MGEDGQGWPVIPDTPGEHQEVPGLFIGQENEEVP